MAIDDFGVVLAIQEVAYDPFFHESQEVLLEKRQLCPEGCSLCVDDDEPLGYLLSHPWRLDLPPALDAEFDDVSAEPDCYYIHDVAVDPSARKRGVGRRLAERAIAVADERDFHTIALIAVQGSSGYWERHGFSVVEELSPEMEEKIRSYGEDARFMTRESRPDTERA